MCLLQNRLLRMTEQCILISYQYFCIDNKLKVAKLALNDRSTIEIRKGIVIMFLIVIDNTFKVKQK